MNDRLHPNRLVCSRRKPRLAALVVSAVLVAGCGGSSAGQTAATAGSTSNPPSGPANTASRTSTGASTAASSFGSGPLGFSRCMRANGVPNFPDPSPSGGIQVQPGAGFNPSSPAVLTAQAKCLKLTGTERPGGPLPAPGGTTHPSAQTLAQLLNIANCMRRHGVPNFPDPRTSLPLNPFGGGQGVITDYDGAILLFPATLNQHAPAYRHATAACGNLARKLGIGPRG